LVDVIDHSHGFGLDDHAILHEQIDSVDTLTIMTHEIRPQRQPAVMTFQFSRSSLRLCDLCVSASRTGVPLFWRSAVLLSFRETN